MESENDPGRGAQGGNDQLPKGPVGTADSAPPAVSAQTKVKRV